MQKLTEIIRNFISDDPQEMADRDAILQAIEMDGERSLLRDNLLFHFTASSIIVNPARTQTLMAYHNLYRSWAWTGGHADGDSDMLALALREANEETGITGLKPLGDVPVSVEVLHVIRHIKRGKPVPSHVHLNVTYALEADDALPIRNQPDENSRVGWLDIAEIPQHVTEETMIPIYILLMLFWGITDLTGTLVLLAIPVAQCVIMAVTRTNSLIHDLLAGTVVVDYASQMIFGSREELIEYQKAIAAERARRQTY